MKLFTQVFPNNFDVDSDYPIGKAKNEIVQGDGLGTPWHEIVINDMLTGAIGALFDHSDVVADNSDEKVGQSQWLSALKTLAKDMNWGDRFKGSFAKGFTYTSAEDVGRGQDGEYYRYIGSDPFPKSVPVGVNPVSFPSDYELSKVTDHNNDTNRNAVGAHDDIYNRKLDNVKSLNDVELINSLTVGQTIEVKSFWNGWAATTKGAVGGGEFYWDANRAKSQHNGGTIIDPSKVTELGSFGVFNNYFVADGVGNGCFVRIIASDYLSIEFFGAVNDNGLTDNYEPFSACVAAANLIDYKVVLGTGGTGYGTTVNLTERTTIIGSKDQPDQRGSDLPSSYLVWIGGSNPMMSTDSGYHLFESFSVENRGSATCWMELNSGAIGNRYRRMDFVLSGGTMFSECVIKSNGNRMGYSHFSDIQVTNPAPSFIKIDGQGTPNGITPMTFDERCIVVANTEDITFIEVIGENIEQINITSSTFIQQQGKLKILDTSNTPNGVTVDVFNFKNNEIDINPTFANASDRVFNIHNCPNINMDGNTLALGGTPEHMATLVNSNVTSFGGNYYASAGEIFEADSASTVNEGVNYPNKANTNGVCKTKSAGVTTLPYGAAIIIDGYACHSKGGHVFEVNVTNGSGWQLRASNVKPNYIRTGQVFTVCIRNVSGGVISAGSFGSGFNGGATVAPADGNFISYTFYFDGATAHEIGRGQELPIL